MYNWITLLYSINEHNILNQLCCCCLVTQSCLPLCNPMDYNIPGLSVPHHLPKFAQVYVHCMEHELYFNKKKKGKKRVS